MDANPPKAELKPAHIPLEQRKVTLSFALFIRLLLNNTKQINLADPNIFLLDYIEVSPDLAALVKELDPEEQITHVQETHQVTGKELELPLVWNKHSWDISYQRFQRQRALSEEQRAINALRHELLEKLKLAIMEDTGLEAEMAQALAVHVITKRQIKKAAVWGVDISQLPEVQHVFVNIY